MSNTAPVEKEQSLDESQLTNAATSSAEPIRAKGILEIIYSLWAFVICPRIGVSITAGVTQLHKTPVFTNSLPKDFVSAITPAFAAL